MDGLCVPYPYLMICYKNIYLRMLFNYMILEHFY